MEAFGHTLTTTLAISPSAPRRQRAGHRGRSSLLSVPRPRSPKFGGVFPPLFPPDFIPSYFALPGSNNFFLSVQRSRAGVRMGAAVGGDEEEVRQAKEMTAARRRWEALIREQKIKVLTPREAGYAIQLSNKTLLDVRPSTEHDKAWVKGSTWIPIFDLDTSVDMQTLAKKITNFVMGGWWSGSPTLAYDKGFIAKVEEKFPKDSDLIVVCQKGLRSLAACELLYNAGFRNLFWVQGGLEAAEDEDFQQEGPQSFKLAGIGGVSEFLGWTDQQRAIGAKEGWGYRLVFTGRLLGLILMADALYFGVQKLGPLLQELRSH